MGRSQGLRLVGRGRSQGLRLVGTGRSQGLRLGQAWARYGLLYTLGVCVERGLLGDYVTTPHPVGEAGHVIPELAPAPHLLTQVDQHSEILVPLSQLPCFLVLPILHCACAN